MTHDNKPPKWIPRVLLYSLLTVFVGIFIWNVYHQLTYVWTIIALSIFLQLAFEPLVVWFESKGIKRYLGSLFCLIIILVFLGGFSFLFGGLLISQVNAFIDSIPRTYNTLVAFSKNNFAISLPDLPSAQELAIKQWGQDVLHIATDISFSFISFLFGMLTVFICFYYLSAHHRIFISSVSKLLPKNKAYLLQRLWSLVQEKVALYLFSRLILAVGNAIMSAIALSLLGSPFWLPLAILSGLLSQFIPIVGTYVAGGIPAILLWTAQGLQPAIIYVVCVIIYQQIEGFVFNPKISQITLKINPAIALLMVIALGILFGPLGAFFALPITAVLQAVIPKLIQNSAKYIGQL